MKFDKFAVLVVQCLILLNQGEPHRCKIILFLFSFIDPVIAVALLVSFVIDSVRDKSTKWYEFERESLMSCLVEVSTWTYMYDNKTIL